MQKYIPFDIKGAVLNEAVPSTKCPPGSFGDLWGCDGRFMNCLRKFYGMTEVLDLDSVIGGIDTYDGPSFVKAVVFQKYNTADFYRGFVIRWDSNNDNANEQVDLIYTLDNGTNWSQKIIYAGGTTSITSTVEMDCITNKDHLYIVIEGQSLVDVYWTGSALITKTTGSSDTDALVPYALSDDGNKSADTDYYLYGGGKYSVRWRLYNSVRGVYGAMSPETIFTLDFTNVSKATANILSSSAGGDSGLMVAGDVFTINSRTYEYIDAGSNVTIPVASLATIAGHMQALTDAINGDSSASVAATAYSSSVLLVSKVAGVAGNAYGLSVSEAGANTNDFSVSSSTLIGGGEPTSTVTKQCKAIFSLPSSAAIAAATNYDAISSDFDTIQIFRTGNLGDGDSAADPQSFYLEQEIVKTGNWASAAAWDALAITLGGITDGSLAWAIPYNDKENKKTSPPQSGVIGRYRDLTFMADAVASKNPYDLVHSDVEQVSGTYFSTFNRHKGSNEEGRILNASVAGDSLFMFKTNSVLHVFKPTDGKFQYNTLHIGRGLTSKYGAHTVGNSVFLITGGGLMMINAVDGTMSHITACNRTFTIDWVSNLDDLWSCFDSKLNASFFLNPAEAEMIVVWHSTHLVNKLKGANFVSCTSGPDIATGKGNRAFFVTKNGLIVSPDLTMGGSGTMWGLDSSYTLNGTATEAGSSLVDDNATLHADMVGALVYMTSGDNVGVSRTISTVTTETGTITFTSEFSNDIVIGDTYAISPVPVGARFWPVDSYSAPQDRFGRCLLNSISIEAQKTNGFTDNVNNFWRIGVYRNGGSTLENGIDTTNTIIISENPADSAGHLQVDGIKIEPYIEQISAGTMFEILNMEAGINITESRKVS